MFYLSIFNIWCWTIECLEILIITKVVVLNRVIAGIVELNDVESLFLFGLLISFVLGCTGIFFFNNPVFNVLSLITVFLIGATLLVVTRSEFVAFMIVIVYVGAVVVFFLFVIMMINVSLPVVVDSGVYLRLISLGVVGFLMINFIDIWPCIGSLSYNTPLHSFVSTDVDMIFSENLSVGLDHHISVWSGDVFKILNFNSKSYGRILFEMDQNLAGIPGYEFDFTLHSDGKLHPDNDWSNIQSIGMLIYHDCGLLFLFVGLLLLLAVIGCIIMLVELLEVFRQPVSLQADELEQGGALKLLWLVQSSKS